MYVKGRPCGIAHGKKGQPTWLRGEVYLNGPIFPTPRAKLACGTPPTTYYHGQLCSRPIGFAKRSLGPIGYTQSIISNVFVYLEQHMYAPTMLKTYIPTIFFSTQPRVIVGNRKRAHKYVLVRRVLGGLFSFDDSTLSACRHSCNCI